MPVMRRRLADRAAGVGPDGERHLVRRHGRRGAARGPARHPVQVPGVARWARSAECSVDEPIANSSMLVLPRITAPASRRRSVTWASNGAR